MNVQHFYRYALCLKKLGRQITACFWNFMNDWRQIENFKYNTPIYNISNPADFSLYQPEVKGWKKHTKMVLNLIVPVGEIEFVVFDDRAASSTFKQFFSCKLGQSNYQRLTVPVGVWLSFRGLGEGVSILLNIASIEHDPTESLSTELKNIKYEW